MMDVSNVRDKHRQSIGDAVWISIGLKISAAHYRLNRIRTRLSCALEQRPQHIIPCAHNVQRRVYCTIEARHVLIPYGGKCHRH